jgi:hypothetical protein
MSDAVADARKELDKEFRQVRDALDSIREAFEKVTAAGPEDDVHGLLESLEDTVKKVRTGGTFGSGAKGHREAREKFLEAKGKA